MSKYLWKATWNISYAFSKYEKWEDCKSSKNLSTNNFMYTIKFYVHGIAAVNLLKIYFLKNRKKICKPSNRDCNRYWKVGLDY